MAETKILVVEDEVLIAKDLQHTLESLGYAVPAIAFSGEEAIRKTEEISPHLVLMDIGLRGDMNGKEAAEQIRARFNTPVVYLTAYANKHTFQRAKATKPFGYIVKPVEEHELRTTIETALYKYRMESKLEEIRQLFTTSIRKISDAMIITNSDGCVTFMNPVAEQLTGWKQKDTLGKNFAHAFPLTNGETPDLTENLLTKTSPDSIVVGLPNNTTLVTRKKTEIPIDGNARFLRDDQRNITTTIFIFRCLAKGKWVEKKLQEDFDKLQSNVVSTTLALVNLFQNENDFHITAHQQRAAYLVQGIAKELELPKEQIQGVSVAASLHDIGMLYVPCEILNKPSQVNDLELGMIRTHPEIGQEILENIEFPWPVAQIVFQHHERVDGSGYPEGIEDKEILLEAKILGVADVVAAMTSHQPYRESVGIDETLEEIEQLKGTLYDSQVVDACARLFTQKGFNLEPN